MKLSKLVLGSFFGLLLTGQSVLADTCSTGLMPLFTGPQAKEICATFSAGTIGTIANNTYAVGRNAADSANINVWKINASDDTVINSSANDYLTLQLDDDDNRLIRFASGSDTDLQMTFGDGTANQKLNIFGTTADAADTQIACIGGGGTSACSGTNSRGGYFIAAGADVGGANAGDTQIGATDDVLVYTGAAGTLALTVNQAQDAAFVGDVQLSTSGKTLMLQEATAGSKCMGSLTLTAATPVVTSTTCAKTASRIFLTRTSIDADTTGDMAVTAISDGVSFSVTSEASDTATVNWLIINEAP
jgi:hypothetical protein